MPSEALVLHVPLAAIPRLLEVHAVAHRLSVSDDYVWRLIKAKKLKGVRLGRRWRVESHVLEAFIAACAADAERA